MKGFEHPIKVAAQRSGLSPHVIRVWEKRYGVIRPDRTETNRRTYTDEDIHRLTLLGQATAVGHSIRNIADLPEEKLEELISIGMRTSSVISSAAEGDYVRDCIETIKKLDTSGFDAVLKQALLKLGHQGLLRQVVAPLTEKVGELWRDGVITAAHEHFASALLRNFLGAAAKSFGASLSAPVIVIATPAGQLHELGATIITTAATTVGWKTIYLGPSLPAAEIAGAALQNQARAVALSIVYPEDDPLLPQELKFLRQYLPPQTALLVGGRASRCYSDTLTEIGAIHSHDLGGFYTCLETLRRENVR